jgi:hypothetical protein
MAQTKYFTACENLDGHAQWEKLHWLPLPIFLIRKKKSQPLIYDTNLMCVNCQLLLHDIEFWYKMYLCYMRLTPSIIGF